MRNDGHYLENLLEREFKKNKKTAFHWRRLHDAKAAKGFFPAQPADFFICRDRGPYHVECKSQDGKTNRLKKFSQHADMIRWHKAGVGGVVVVHFHEVDRLFVANVTLLPFGKPSWVLNYKNSEEFDSELELCKYLMGG